MRRFLFRQCRWCFFLLSLLSLHCFFCSQQPSISFIFDCIIQFFFGRHSYEIIRFDYSIANQISYLLLVKATSWEWARSNIVFIVSVLVHSHSISIDMTIFSLFISIFIRGRRETLDKSSKSITHYTVLSVSVCVVWSNACLCQLMAFWPKRPFPPIAYNTKQFSLWRVLLFYRCFIFIFFSSSHKLY